MAVNPYAQYQNSKILTASPAELTLMLYDGAIKFGNIAIAAMNEKDVQKAHLNIIKVQKIIEEFERIDFGELPFTVRRWFCVSSGIGET